ncbi:MAG: hypothetical protein WCI18_10550 [Pseudomonadota bacterium]
MPHPISNHVHLASAMARDTFLSSDDESLDLFLGGGLPLPGVSLWTGSLGSRVREILLKWVVSQQKNRQCVLWVMGLQSVQILASSWASRGVDLSKLYFSYSSSPLAELKEVFFSDIFPLIILDSIVFSNEDQAFLSQIARRKEKSLVILQNQNVAIPSVHPTIRHKVNVSASGPDTVLLKHNERSFTVALAPAR